MNIPWSSEEDKLMLLHPLSLLSLQITVQLTNGVEKSKNKLEPLWTDG